MACCSVLLAACAVVQAPPTYFPAAHVKSLRDFDLSCQAPDMMIDIHEELEGDIAESLQIYSSDENFDFLKRAIVRWGIPMDEEQLLGIRAVLDSYECE